MRFFDSAALRKGRNWCDRCDQWQYATLPTALSVPLLYQIPAKLRARTTHRLRWSQIVRELVGHHFAPRCGVPDWTMMGDGQTNTV
jgi:hypothetical protein